MTQGDKEVAQKADRIPWSKVYLPYLPAILTLGGAVMIALGLFLGWADSTNETYQILRFVGAAFAGIGALWSAHNQIQGAATAKERDEKIIELSGRLRGQLTGGDSFCYGYPVGGADQQSFEWMFALEGQFPLTNVNVRICDLAKLRQQQPGGFGDPVLQYDAVFPGKFLQSHLKDTRQPSHGYNLFFIARNGSWVQQIRWVYVNGGLVVANRVLKDGKPADQPLLLHVSPEFSRLMSSENGWDQLPPYSVDNPKPEKSPDSEA